MAIIRPSFDSKRQNLRDIIPLPAPFHIGIEPTRYCNLRCFFCQHSTRGCPDDRFVKKGQALQHMEYSLFQKAASDIMAFPVQPKKIQLVGMGEPILNPELGNMVRYLRKIGFEGRILTYTNGVGLTPDTVDDLMNSGLTSLQVSVYGMTAEDFQNLAGTEVEMGRYLENLRYLYDHRNGVQIRLKTTDDVADSEEKKARFYELFHGLCDQIFIEHIINIPNQMGNQPVKMRNVTQYSEGLSSSREICPWMFYQMHVNSDGDVFFCDILAKPKRYAIGNIRKNSLLDIWNSRKRTELLCRALREGQDAVEECVDCDDRNSMTAPEEYLDDCRELLLQKLTACVPSPVTGRNC